MNVLIGCEYSGIVRDAFKKQGHNAWSCDILPTERPGNHYRCDILEAITDPDVNWHFIGLHLPCTALALSGNRHYGVGKPKHNLRLKSIKWTANVWEAAKLYSNSAYLENPMNVLGGAIGSRSQAIQPYQFGHPEMKETWLWLYNLPKLKETNNVYNKMMKLPLKERERIYRQLSSGSGIGKGHEKSLTYTGIAEAMAKQWG